MQQKFQDLHGTLGCAWERAAIFAVNDGLTSNVSFILGVCAATAFHPEHVFIAGCVGMLAGAVAMASGEWISMTLKADHEDEELRREDEHLRQYPKEEQAHFMELLGRQGMSQETREAIRDDINARPPNLRHEMELRMHAQLELGLDPDQGREDPSKGALFTFFWFQVGACIPLMPWAFELSPSVSFVACVLVSFASLTCVAGLLSRFLSAPFGRYLRRHVLVSTACFTVAYLAGMVYHYLLVYDWLL
ncbi:Vacuolar iron transporter 1.2 [Diplonema papillatum]|nr:Vacuolar iron transporter 1.2 [Diplonema papillatum]